MSSSVSRPNIAFLVRSLERGGAERQLSVLARGLRAHAFPVAVITFYDGGALRQELDDAGVRVISLRKQSRWDVLTFTARLLRVLRDLRPDVLYTFLTVPNVIGALIKPAIRGTRLLWAIRASNMDLSQYDCFARGTDRLERILSHRADLIVFNSTAGRNYALTRNYPAPRCIVIPNGIDTQTFHHDATGRQRLRHQWGVTDHEVLIGLAARVDPMKDHATFLSAAALVLRTSPHARFVCVGDATGELSKNLKELTQRLQIEKEVIWAGSQDDMKAVYSAFDIACSSSITEGFSNAIAEAMACETVCVVTAVGDSAQLVDSTGLAIRSRDPAALAAALSEVIRWSAERKAQMGAAARARIKEQFSVESMILRTAAAFAELCDNNVR